ncbi:MAG TPA: hypothetical protein VIU11_04000 [Nakamurella sp.]
MTSGSALTRDAQPRGPMADQPRVLPPLTFRQVELSAAGWTALLAPGAVVGLAVGLTGTRGRLRPGRVAAATVVGAVVLVALARVVDELRWRRSAVCIELDEPDAVLDLLQAVRAEGVHADMIRSADGPSGTGDGYALRYRARDDRRVRAVLSAQQG